MNKRELERFRKLIVAEKTSVVESPQMQQADITAIGNSQVGNQSYSNHMADVGTDAMEQEQACLHASIGTDYLLALEQALVRGEKKIYGVCEECGEKIPDRRLEAYLAARLCVPCKSRLEKHRG